MLQVDSVLQKKKKKIIFYLILLSCCGFTCTVKTVTKQLAKGKKNLVIIRSILNAFTNYVEAYSAKSSTSSQAPVYTSLLKSNCCRTFTLQRLDLVMDKHKTAAGPRTENLRLMVMQFP